MNFVHTTLYLSADEEDDEAVQWGIEVFDTRDKALDGACTFLERAGYSAPELAFARSELAYGNVHTATSLGTMIHLLMLEVQ